MATKTKKTYRMCPKCKTNEHVELKTSEHTSWMECTKCGRRTQCSGVAGDPRPAWETQEPQMKGYDEFWYYRDKPFNVSELPWKRDQAMKDSEPQPS